MTPETSPKAAGEILARALIDAGLLPEKTVSFTIECPGRWERMKITATYLADHGKVEAFAASLPRRLEENEE